MKSKARKFLALTSFYTCLPGLPKQPYRAEWLKTVGSLYPWTAPFIVGLANGSMIAFLYFFVLMQISIPLQAILLLTIFYGFRGLRLIDGYVDLGEGILSFITRFPPRDKVWEVIRNPTKGAYGILSAILLLAWQFMIYQLLLHLGFVKLLVVFILSGASGSLALSAAHLGTNQYLPDSAFMAFGEALRGTGRFVLTLVIFVISSFLLLTTAFPIYGNLGLLSAVTVVAIITGICLRKLVLKTVAGLNGDFIGYVLLVSEVIVLFVVICCLGL